MTPEDEAELHRLCDLLRTVAEGLDPASPLIEAVEKAALGLSLAFIHGLRAKVEEMALGVGRPLKEAELEWLRSIGINPGAE